MNVGANRATAPTEPVEPPSQPDVPMSARSAWPNGGTSSEGPPTARPTTAPAAPQQPAPPAVSRSKSGVPDQPEGDVDPSWRAAEEQKERGNRRYAIKSWGEAHACYRKALDELTKHPKHGTNSPEGRALATKAASYHANSAAALMQLGKLPEALAECDAALNADRTLGKALLRVAHVQLMLGDTDEARRYYVEAAGVGASAESEAGVKACAADEQQASRLHAELIMCRRAAASTVGNASSTQQLKTLVSTLEAACNRAPHNASLRSLQAEALSASGRMAEAHALCEAQIAGAQAHRAHTAIWLYTLGRVLYDSRSCQRRRRSLRRAYSGRTRRRAQSHWRASCSGSRRSVRRATMPSSAAIGGGGCRVRVRLRSIRRTRASMPCSTATEARRTQNGAPAGVGRLLGAIALNRSYAKAYLRRAELRLRCGDRTRALDDFSAAQRLDMNGPVGQEAGRRVSEMRKDSAREAAASAAARRRCGRSGGWPSAYVS